MANNNAQLLIIGATAVGGFVLGKAVWYHWQSSFADFGGAGYPGPNAPQSVMVRGVDLPTEYRGTRAATRRVLIRRACFAGRKGNSARRRLGFKPSTSALGFRATLLLRQWNERAARSGLDALWLGEL